MTIPLSELTTVEVNGTGILDKMMRTVKAHLIEEYDKQRLRGGEYSQVYLTAVQTVIDQSIRFITERESAELIKQQIELTKQQVLKAQKEVDLIQAQIEKMQFERDLTEAQVLQIEAQTLNVPKEGEVLDAQVCKLKAEYDNLVETKARIICETALLAEKKVTEQAQTKDNIAAENSVIGRQNEVLRLQGQGFIRLAEQRAAEIAKDLLQVQIGIDSGTDANATFLFEDQKSVFAALTSGLNFD